MRSLLCRYRVARDGVTHSRYVHVLAFDALADRVQVQRTHDALGRTEWVDRKVLQAIPADAPTCHLCGLRVHPDDARPGNVHGYCAFGGKRWRRDHIPGARAPNFSR